METLYEDAPEEIFEHAFAFMDAHPEVPAGPRPREWCKSG
jgi:hypothetical protein